MPENYFMGLVGAALGTFMLIMILRTIFKKYPISLPIEQKNRLKDIFRWMFNDREIIKRLIITVGILIVLRFAFFIPLPGIDFSALQEFFNRIGKTQGGALFGIITMFSGGAFGRLTIFSLGLMPLFSSCGLIQFASIFIPGLRKLSFGGEGGREKISKYTYVLTIILCVVQSYFISLWLENPARFEGMRIVTMSGLSFRLITMATMTASVMFLLFVADIITRYGIGNGVAVIAVSYLPLRILTAGNQVFILTKYSQLHFPPFLLIILLCGLIYIIFNITNRARAIEIQDQNSNKASIYFRPSIVGDAPLGYAQSIILLPITIVSFVHSPWASKFSSILMRGHIIYTMAYAILIFIFTYLYAWIVFDSEYIYGIMNKYGYSLVSKDKLDKNRLDNSMSKVLIITGLFLIGIAMTPDLAMMVLKIPYLVATLIGGAGIISAVGVFSDVIRQLEFYKDKKESAIKNWSICYVAFDEIEAKIKSEFLKSKGISALVEPLRFTWGMPIRTMVDQYRIYVPSDKKEEARNLII